MNEERFLTSELADRTRYKSVKDGIERNDIDVYERNGYFWVETGTYSSCSDALYMRVIKEVKRLFPHLKHYWDRLYNN